MADDAALQERILSTIAKGAALPREAVTLESTFGELNLQSLDLVTIIFALEEEFGIQISTDDFSTEAQAENPQTRTIREIVDVLTQVLAKNGAAV